MNSVAERFLRYVCFDTQSNPDNSACPSSPGQMVFAQALKAELVSLGLSDVTLDDNGYLMARLPANIDTAVPAIGFIAHMDTAPDASGYNVKAQIVENYQGGDIALGKGDEVLSPIQYPELNQLRGCNLITTDGTTLLGADNKAGVAEIITAMEWLLAHPEIKHGEVCIGFTPDEEIGRGADKFDVEKFGAEWAYTIDGGPVGELEFENFNAANAKVVFHGVNVHPGTAKDKMVNSMTLACQFHAQMPSEETPECTDGYQGFYHLTSSTMSVASSQLNYILRDFDLDGLQARKARLKAMVDDINQGFKSDVVTLIIEDSYFNMKEKVEPFPNIIDNAKQAMIDCGITPMIKPIRGGTDGARLSFMGLPCPNIFTGGYNFHGIHEFATIEGMQKAVEVIVRLTEKTALNIR
ncbi:tripeptide aminopeptidase [Vibrio xiamenensis]|uniref:Peptidase T n=1 Tax=Vibrio xiamenensis TaxID=861298 RepID=A0A1G8A4J4_9VIBR|nr:peptidase T [Vibrio xiamenensis]SDH15786.1 tripeptide aminopeptidase [Vibrio xiamenensis]